MLYILILVGFISRLMPHPANVTPILALGLLGGCYFNRKVGLLVPLAAMLLADLIIGFYSLPIMLAVYLAFGVAGLLGHWLKKHKSVVSILGSTLAGSILFFITTNFAIWQFGTFYEHTTAGLISCYVSALPFFRNSLMGNIVFVAVFFSAYEWIGQTVDHKLASLLVFKRVEK